MLKARLTEEQIDDSHIKNLDLRMNRLALSNTIPIENILVENSTYNRGANLKIRILREKLLPNICSVCDMKPEWNGKPLSLQIDHINGIRNDNRIENIRLICPNCHSQTATFAGRNSRIKPNVCECGNSMSGFRMGQKCRICSSKEGGIKNRKVKDRPTKEELQILLWEKPTIKIAKDYGISDVAVCKWAKSYGLQKPPRGYWAKKYAGKLR